MRRQVEVTPIVGMLSISFAYTMSSQPTSEIELLRAAYVAFNARDADAALALLMPDVTLPRTFKGGFVHGHEEIRTYWTEQWSEINLYDEPVAFHSEEGGRILVDVHQVVRDLAGTILADEHIGHRFTFEHGLIQSMEICPLSSSGFGDQERPCTPTVES